MRTARPPYRLFAILVLALAGCSGGDDDDGAGAGVGGVAGGAAGGSAAAGGLGGTSGPPPGGGAGGLGGGGNGGPAPGGSEGGGAGGSGGSAGAAGSMAGAGGAGGTTAPPRPTECNGKPLPERAKGPTGPFMIGPEAAGLEPYWPTTAWKPLAPEMLGFDPAKLQAAVDFETPNANSQAVMVIRHGYVAAEKYFAGASATMRHESYSMAKSFSSALVGIAIEAKLIASVDEKLCKYYPEEWDCNDAADPRSRITIAHAMNISTGLRWNEDWRSTATGTNDVFLASFDMVGTVLAREAVDEPGSKVRYSTGDPALLTGVLQGATGKTALAYAREVMLGPIGAMGINWNSDSSGRTTTYAGLQATAAEYAKFGYLFLNKGKWDGKQIVPESWVDFTTQAADPCVDWYRYLWHQNAPVRLGPQDPSCDSFFCAPASFANLPADAYFAEGINGQFIFIVPSADLVVVRLANDGAGSENWDAFAVEFLGKMLDAIE
jgi:CubicO group peptidase (beta-lactamase class C family)